nr:Nephrin [Phoronopsis harmeri]
MAAGCNSTLKLTLLMVTLLSCFVTVNGQVQSFRKEPTNQTVAENRTAVFECEVENRAGQVQWTKNGFALGYNRALPGLSRYRMDGTDSTGVFNLVIVNVNLGDDGAYECQVQPQIGHPLLKSTAYLSVQMPPTAVRIEGYPKEGGSNNIPVASVPWKEPFLNLTCIAPDAKPAATLKWYHGNDEISGGYLITNSIAVETDATKKTRSAVSILSIVPRKGDSGSMFRCQAAHPAWTSPHESTVQLSVLYPPDNPVISGYDDRTVKSTGDTIDLTCTANGGNPLAQVHWYKNNEKIDYSFDSGAGKSFNIYTFVAAPSDDNAIYRCEISNSQTAQPLVVQVRIQVYFAPTSVFITGHENAKAGETITLTCRTAPSNPAAEISWSLRGRELISNAVTTTTLAGGGFETVKNVTVPLKSTDNKAEYMCVAVNNKLGETTLDSVTLDVLYPPGPPQITGYDENTDLIADTFKRLSCMSFGGNPAGTITWWKGDKHVNPDAVTEVLGNRATSNIDIPVKADDNLAEYKCNVTNSASDKALITSVVLHVLFHPSEVTITPEPHPAKAGQKMNITCKSGSSNPASSLMWLKNGSPIDHSEYKSGGNVTSDYGGVSTISYLEIVPTADDDNLEYGCRATNNKLKRSTEDAIKLDVLYKPQFIGAPPTITIQEGSDYIINMTATANPAPSAYTWYKNGEKLKLVPMRKRRDLEVAHFSATDALLNITGAKKEDAGSYKCEATNAEGTMAHEFQLVVQYAAIISKITTPLMENAGQAITLECQVDSMPVVTADMVKWTRDGYDMARTAMSFDATTKTAKLTIASVVKGDTGNFTCTANNKIGAPAVKNAELVIKYKPEIAKSPQNSKSAAEIDSQGLVVCKAEGAPPPTFTWEKNGVALVNGSKYLMQRDKIDTVHYNGVLRVVNVTWNDYSEYKCTATNELGQDEYGITLDGTSAPDPPTDIKLVNYTHNAITLKWKGGFDGGLAQTYMVRYRPTKALSKGYTFAEAFHPVYTVTGLQLGVEYELTVRGRNSKGHSAYQEKGIVVTTSSVLPAEKTAPEEVEEVPLVIILSVTIVGVLLLILNIFLIMFFIRRRRKNKMDKDSTDGSSQINTIEMYSTSTAPAYAPSMDDSKSYTTYDKSIDEYPDEFSRPYEDDEDIKKVFLPPMDPYGTYPTHTIDSQRSFFVNKGASTYLDDSVVGAPTNWPQPESPYKSSTLPRSPMSPQQYEEDIYADQLRRANKTLGSKPDMHKPGPPPPPVRSSSKGTIEVPKAMPPIPARNYAPSDLPRYTPAPGSLYGTGPRQGPPSTGNAPGSEMRGALV